MKQTDHFQILREETVYRGYLDVMKGVIDIYSKREEKQIEITREVIYKQDAIAVLMKNTDTEEFIFTKQFRYPTVKNDNGYILEIPAGAIEENEDPLQTVQREVLEETGYEIETATPISTTYVSPGYSTERTHVYYAEVSNKQKIKKGGGVKKETEEIEIVAINTNCIDKLMNGEIVDAKSLLALQWYQLNKLK